jgi:diadenosine tetraphosphate (Ap4A) HIT family hydrolase
VGAAVETAGVSKWLHLVRCRDSRRCNSVRRNSLNARLQNDVFDDCLLCEALDGRWNPDAVWRDNSLHTQVIAETPHLVLMADLSPLVDGHSLIVTKSHISSFGQARGGIWEELAEIRRIAIGALVANGGRYFLFEHGASPVSPKVGCIAHAHIHVVPCAVDVPRHLARIATHPFRIARIEMKLAVPTDGSDYLYYEDMNGHGCTLVSPQQPLRRQYIRSVVAQELGIAEWDWTMVLANTAERMVERR